MKKRVAFLISFLLLLGISAQAKIVDYVAAVVNGKPILYSEVIKFAKENGIKDLLVARDKVIENEILLTQAEAEGIKVSEKEIEKALREIAKKSGAKNLEEFKKLLKSQGISFEELKDNLRKQLLIAKLIDKEVKSKVSVSDIEVEKACRKLEGKPLRDVYYIYSKDKKEIEKALELLKSGIPFEKVAKGKGHVGKVGKGTLIKPLDIAVWSTKPGNYKLVETKDGYFIVYVKSEELPTCNREKVRRKLYLKKFQKALKDYVEELKRKASVKVYM